MAIDLINRCRTAAGAYRTNAEPHIGSTVDLSARDVMSYAALLDEASAEIERLRAALAPFVAMRDCLTVGDNVKLITKKLDGMTPITVTVTKAQFLAALGTKDNADG